MTETSKHKVLVVEDNIDILDNIELTLKLHGFDVLTQMSGADVMDLATRELPDLVLLDIMIPKPNGYQLCYLLKTQESTRHIPVILFSAKKQDLDKQLGFRMGADRYLEKPFRNEELLALIREFLPPAAPGRR